MHLLVYLLCLPVDVCRSWRTFWSQGSTQDVSLDSNCLYLLSNSGSNYTPNSSLLIEMCLLYR